MLRTCKVHVIALAVTFIPTEHGKGWGWRILDNGECVPQNQVPPAGL